MAYRADDQNTVVCLEQLPTGSTIGNLVLLHGLEGSAHAGYIESLSGAALLASFSVYRLNARTCGGNESLSATMYHSGLSSDVAYVIAEITKRSPLPVFLVGFSLGGNVALKFTGELGGSAGLAGTISVSAPIDLARCVRAIDKASNRIYARRFVSRLKDRIRRKSVLSPETYSAEFLDSVRTIWEFDDRYTAPLFGFGNAANYYATQSAINYVSQIRTPTLMVAAQDDPLVPFEIYNHPAIRSNPHIAVLAPRHGGHIGFLSRKRPRFWLDQVILQWLQGLAAA